MARAHILLAATAAAALVAGPAAAQSFQPSAAAAQQAGQRYLSWPGQSSGPVSGSPLEVVRVSGSPDVPRPRQPDRYSGGGVQPQYQPQPQPQYQPQPSYAPPPSAPPPRLQQPAYEPQPQPQYQPQPQQTWQPEPQPQPPVQQQAYSPPPPAQYTPQPQYQPLPQPTQTQPAQAQPTQSQPTQTQPTQTGGQAAATDNGVRYYSVHRGAGRTPDPIQQTYVEPQDAMVALTPVTGDSLAERQRQATAEETALDLIRQLPPDQLALLLDAPQ